MARVPAASAIEVEDRDEVLMRVGEGGNDKAADERGGQNAGEDAGPAERGAEGKFAAPAFTGRRAPWLWPDPLRRWPRRLIRPVADDQQEEEQDTVERLFEVAGR
jgi:hypothetical protein